MHTTKTVEVLENNRPEFKTKNPEQNKIKTIKNNRKK